MNNSTTCVLVTGGAGYIGSHTSWQLAEAGYRVVVLDNLSTGNRWAIHATSEFVLGDAGDMQLVRKVMREFQVAAVIHFAGHIVVSESVIDPLKYYRNNFCVSRNLVECCIAEGVGKFIFSSTAAVYGIPAVVPVGENTPTAPINPYGQSKLMTEYLLRDVEAGTALHNSVTHRPFRYIALRYFNAAGARLDGQLGQATPDATHLIKVACQAACGERKHVAIYGTDYPTDDGTCVRDYIHVEDLAAAHIAALGYLGRGGSSQILNCGYGRGFSVRQVLDVVRKVSGVEFEIQETDRRPGDPPILISDPSRIRSVLNWKPRLQDLSLICESAYQWERDLSLKRVRAWKETATPSASLLDRNKLI